MPTSSMFARNTLTKTATRRAISTATNTAINTRTLLIPFTSKKGARTGSSRAARAGAARKTRSVVPPGEKLSVLLGNRRRSESRLHCQSADGLILTHDLSTCYTNCSTLGNNLAPYRARKRVVRMRSKTPNKADSSQGKSAKGTPSKEELSKAIRKVIRGQFLKNLLTSRD